MLVLEPSVIKRQSCWDPAVPVVVSQGGGCGGTCRAGRCRKDCVTNPGCSVISHETGQKRGLHPVIGQAQALVVSSVQKKMLKKSH